MAVQVKICGLCDEAAVHAVALAKAEYAGFVTFPASPRHVSPARAAQLRQGLADNTYIVSVLVDPDNTLLEQLHAQLRPHFFQLHGNETPARVAEIKAAFPSVKIIKAITLSFDEDVKTIAGYTNCADMLLFDAKPAAGGNQLPGGNGLRFDWSLLKGKQIALPWFLSGGLNQANVADAIKQTGAARIDVSSGVETAPGKKSPALIQTFIETVRAL